MINLLPPALKEQLTYSRYNRVVVRYIRLIVLVMVALTGTFAASLYFLNQQAEFLARDVVQKQELINSYAGDVKLAKAAAERLNAIKFIQASQTRYSLLLSDLAKVLPRGVAIDSITLTGDDKKPVRITVAGPSYDAMLAFRDSFAASPRLTGVDLESIGPIDGGFQAAVVIGFVPGQAK